MRLLLLLPLLAGCNLLQLTPASEAIRTRVAGIKASPAEIGLGESTRLEALLVHPEGAPPSDLGAIWFACVEAGGATGCLGVDFASLAGGGGGDDDVDPRDFQFGVGPSFEYTAEGGVLEEAWAELEPDERVEGLTVLISVNYVQRSDAELRALLLELITAATTGDDEELARLGEAFGGLLADESTLSAARRVVISDKTAGAPDPVACGVDALLPNVNPSIGGLLLHLDEEGLDEGFELGPLTFVEPGAALTLRPVLPGDAAEDYLFINREAVTECRSEAPFYAWVTNGGASIGDYSFVAEEGDLDEVAGLPKTNTLNVPADEDFVAPIDLWLVIRDRRGGIDWSQYRFARLDE